MDGWDLGSRRDGEMISWPACLPEVVTVEGPCFGCVPWFVFLLRLFLVSSDIQIYGLTRGSYMRILYHTRSCDSAAFDQKPATGQAVRHVEDESLAVCCAQS